MLWQQAAGGAVTEAMQKVIDNEREAGATSRLLEQAEETFRDYAAQEDPTSAADHVPLKPSDDLTMSFNGFYNAYLQPHFGDRRPAPAPLSRGGAAGCFTCDRTRFVLDAIDLDADGGIEWPEWRFWCLGSSTHFAIAILFSPSLFFT